MISLFFLLEKTEKKYEKEKKLHILFANIRWMMMMIFESKYVCFKMKEQ